MEPKRRREWQVYFLVLALLLLLALPTAYLGGYFWLAEVSVGRWVPDNTPVVHRVYPAKWLVTIYEPAGRVEEKVTQRDVEIGSFP